MEAKNLRIGNLFLDHEAEKNQIIWSIEEIKRNTNTSKLLGVSFRSGSCWTSLEWVQPIELTNVIMDKLFGEPQFSNGWLFKTDQLDVNIEFIESGEHYYPQIKQYPELSSEEIQIVSLNRIKYFHELQNLIFAIQGEEFEFEIETLKAAL